MCRVGRHRTQTVYISSDKKKFRIFVQLKRIVMKMKYKSMGGLEVKNGRLENDREPGLSGIEQAARIKKSMSKAGRVGEIADGIALAEVRENFYKI